MVYVTQECVGKNILPAREYGDLVVLLGPNQLVLDTVYAVKELKLQLQSFNDRDFILPIGDPCIIGLVTSVAAQFNKGRVKFLKWDRQTQKYYSVTSDIGESK